MFKDRAEAAELLSEKLNRFQFSSSIVLAITNGAIVMGKIIAQRLNLPLELILTDDIGHPNNKDYSIGTVCLQSRTIKRRVYVSREYIDQETGRIRSQLLDKYHKLTGKDQPLPLQNKTMLLIADSTTELELIQKNIELVKNCKPAGITVVIPVLSEKQLYTFLQEAKEVVYLKTVPENDMLDTYFENLEPVSEDELTRLLQASADPKPLRA